MNDVRIPRDNLLKRYIEVEKDGEVNIKGNPLVLYSIMMKTRLSVILVAIVMCAKSVLIATRYAFIRT
jgi:hypothetical protein